MRREQRAYEAKKAKVALSVVEQYHACYLLNRKLDLAKRRLLRLKKILQLTQSLEQQGKISRIDSLRSELQSSNGQLYIEQIKNEREEAFDALRLLLNIKGSKKLTLTEPPEFDYHPPSLRDAL